MTRGNRQVSESDPWPAYPCRWANFAAPAVGVSGNRFTAWRMPVRLGWRRRNRYGARHTAGDGNVDARAKTHWTTARKRHLRDRGVSCDVQDGGPHPRAGGGGELSVVPWARSGGPHISVAKNRQYDVYVLPCGGGNQGPSTQGAGTHGGGAGAGKSDGHQAHEWNPRHADRWRSSRDGNGAGGHGNGAGCDRPGCEDGWMSGLP